MPDMQQQQLNPYSILDNNLTALQGYYKNKIKTLQGYGLNPDQYNQIMMGWQEEYDARKFKIISARLQLDDIKLGVDAGKIDPMAGEQAMMGLVLPEDTYNAMYPKQQPYTRGMSPTGMNTYAKRFDRLRDEVMIGYPEGKKWYKWDTKKALPKKITEIYLNERKIANLRPTEIAGFNQSFMDSMQQNDGTWEAFNKLIDPKTGDPRMVVAFRPDSPMNRGFMNQFESAKPVSPMAKALQQKPTFNQRVRKVGTPWGPMINEAVEQRRSKKEQPTAQELRQQNTKEAYELGKKLGYWE